MLSYIDVPQYNARNSAAVKLVTKRRNGVKYSRGGKKVESGSAKPAHYIIREAIRTGRVSCRCIKRVAKRDITSGCGGAGGGAAARPNNGHCLVLENRALGENSCRLIAFDFNYTKKRKAVSAKIGTKTGGRVRSAEPRITTSLATYSYRIQCGFYFLIDGIATSEYSTTYETLPLRISCE
ncbi:hypothetical protein EVAR_97282_1 [Eumeta japonica]|uniref:Uncharacterized protein n=1 Tax=Eumeta variegata TaxID=151549 RepID=A0A4C1XFG9_EUMVA|nr:hypothetical protein EVAR_97282_1 [Eumeta japonica]